MATKANVTLIKQAVLQQMNARRQSTSHTKTRGEVSGGGKKPWRQKGTGRARAGSSRSPIWVGGGITFGPRSARNFKTLLPKKMALKAKTEIYQLLSNEKRVFSADSLHLKEPRTKMAVKLFQELGRPAEKTLLITEKLEAELILATSNLPGVNVKVFEQVSLLDLAEHRAVVMEKACFEKVYGTTKAASAPAKKVATKPKAKEAKS